MAIAERPSAGPLTATGTDPRNVDGQAICITVFSTVKWWGRAVAAARVPLRPAGARARTGRSRGCRSSTSRAGRSSSRLPGAAPALPAPVLREQLQRRLGGVHRRLLPHPHARHDAVLGQLVRLPRRRCPPAASRSTSSATRSRPATSTPPIPTRRRRWCSRRSSSTRSCATSAQRTQGLDPEAFARAWQRLPHRRAAVPVNARSRPLGPGRRAHGRSRRSRPAPRRTCARTSRGCAPAGSPLARLPRTHFGRWVIVGRLRARRRAPARPPGRARTCSSPRASTAPLDTYLDELCERAGRRGAGDLGPLHRRARSRPPAPR